MGFDPRPIDEVINSLTCRERYVAEPLANCGVSIIKNGRLVHSSVSGFVDVAKGKPAIPFLLSTRIRFASVSKTITAAMVHQLSEAGRFSLDDNIFALLGIEDSIRRVVPVRTVLDHTSSLTDDAGWYVDLPHSLKDMVVDNFEVIASNRQPGAYFQYCNLNYVLLGWLVEVASGRRFHQEAVERVLKPLNIGGGFNWCGVPNAERANRAPACKNINGQFVEQVDHLASVLDGEVVDRLGRPIKVSETRHGEDVSIFSPHAGMRMSIEEAAFLAWSFGANDAASRARRTVSWKVNNEATNGSTGDGMFAEFALGLQKISNPNLYPTPLLGHYGDALGFRGGAWYDELNALSFAYSMNGFVDYEGRYPEDPFRPQEVALFEALGRSQIS